MITTIEKEIEHMIDFLSHGAGFSVSLNGDLTIAPIYGAIEHWEVAWQEQEDDMIFDYQKLFPTLEGAAQFFVEKRRYMCLGADFVQMYNAPDESEKNV